MSVRRWSTANRPSPEALEAALWTFLCAATLAGGFVGAVIADWARVRRNTRRLERNTR